MMKKSIKKSMSLMIALLVMFGIFAGTTTVFAQDSSGEKYPLYLTMDILQNPDYGHSSPGAPGQLKNPEHEDMWKNLTITVSDQSGTVVNAEREVDRHFKRYVGEYAVGEELTITVDISGIADGYHLSYEEDYEYAANNYNVFKVKFEKNVSNAMNVRIPFGYMDVKFDLQGGNINGNQDPIIRRVKKDNTVDFSRRSD